MIVAQDGTGQFTSIQEAINSIPKDNKTDVTIQIKDGVYKEKLVIDKPYITLEGACYENVKITYDDYALKQLPNGEKMGTFATYTALITGDYFTAKNITFENSAGCGSVVGQAVAVYIDADIIRFENCALLGHQDTLFIAPLPPKPIEGNRFGGPRDGLERKVGRSYFHHCYIEGDIDFIFGSGKAFFEECEIFSLNRNEEVNGYITAASTPIDEQYGFVFHNCRLKSDANSRTVYLGRPWRDYAKTIFINCWMGAHIKEEGWHNWEKRHAEETTFYAEYNSSGPGGVCDRRVKWSKQLTEKEAREFSLENVLGLNMLRNRNDHRVTIFLAGDSTVEDVEPNKGNQQGWGQQLPHFFTSGVRIINKAKGGRSTKSFINEGRLQDISKSIQENDYLFIQFGHNDQKIEDESRGTEPWGTYQMYLTLFIDAARERGAKPILITPVHRRNFVDGHFVDAMGEYPAAMKELAANLHVPVIDLWEKSRIFYEKLGEEETKQLFAWYELDNPDKPQDNTHFSKYGAKKIAELVIEGIKELELDICHFLIEQQEQVK